MLLLVILFLGVADGQGQTRISPLPPPTGYVNDYANVIDLQTRSRLETILMNLDRQHRIQVAVVTVDTTGDQDIFDYSLAVARGWGIGYKGENDNGLLLLAAINDRKYFTQVSEHLEGDLPDGLVGQIQRERLVPHFRRGEYGEGLSETVQAYIATLAQQRGFSIEGIDQSYAYRERQREPATSPGMGQFASACSSIVIILVIVLLLASANQRGRPGGCWNLLFLFSVLGSGRSRSSWGGSRSGWSGGGFGGGGGGFGGFGGGGSFGGGGAGGSW